jgi:hypothetical protein
VVDAWDFCIDSPDRRKDQANPSPHRRAFVHDFDDGLTVNWEYDYPGGVKINYLKEIHAKPKKTMASPGAINLTIDGNTKIEGNLNVDGDLDGKVQVKWLSPAQAAGTAVLLGLIKDKKELAVPLDQILSAILQLAAAQHPMQDGWRWCNKCGALFHAGKKGVCPAAAGGEHSQEGSGHYLVAHS